MRLPGFLVQPRLLMGSALGASLLLAFGLTFAAFAFEARCDARALENRTLMGRVNGLLHGQIALDDPGGPDGLGRHARRLAQMNRWQENATRQLVSLNPDSRELRRVAESAEAYGTSLRRELRLRAAGRAAAADTLDDRFVRPSLFRLSTDLNDAEAALRAELRSEDRVSSIVLFGALLLVTTLLCLAVWRLERARRSAALQTAEHRVLEDSEARFRALIQNSDDVVMVLDRHARVTYASPSLERVFGYDSARALGGKGLRFAVHPDDQAKMVESFDLLAAHPGHGRVVEARIQAAGGAWRWVRAEGRNLFDDPHVRGVLMTYRDVTGQKDLEAKLVSQAFYDDLTGLANRALFMDRASRALSASRRDRVPVAVMVLDVDNFKTINDSLGHAAGDALLVGIADRLGRCVRPMDTVARLGGDEFAIIASVEDAATAEAVARRIAEALSAPFELAGEREVRVEASLGIALCNDSSSDEKVSVGDLLRDADVAMYAAKTSDIDTYKVFRPAMRSAVLSQLELESALQGAVSQRELEVHFQPVIDLDSGAVVDLEALVRWRTKELGLVAPEHFIPLAEKTGLIVPIGSWVLREACATLRTLQVRLGLWPLGVSVNVSARQLGDPSFVQDVYDALRESELDPSCLTLEITESILMTDAEGMADRLGALRELGVRVAIDDFGTGYSSLSYLKRFPMDAVKIDRSFVDGMARGPEDAAVAHAIIKLAETFDLVTVAEGIDTAEQLGELTRLGCTLGQGFLISKPLPIEQLESFMKIYRAPGKVDARAETVA